MTKAQDNSVSGKLERKIEDASCAPVIFTLALVAALGPAAADAFLVAIPSIAADIGQSAAVIQGTLAIYFLGFAAGQIFFGPFYDSYDRVGMLTVGLLFALFGSLACSFAESIEMFSVARFITGVGAGSAAVVSRALVGDLFNGSDSASSYTLLTIAIASAPLLAPAVGGVLTAAISWRAVFFTLAFYSSLSLALVLIFLRNIQLPARRSKSFTTRLNHLCGHLADPFQLQRLMLSGLLIAPMFIYITAAPILYSSSFGFQPQVIGILIGANLVSTVIGGLLNKKLLKIYSPQPLLIVATGLICCSSLLVLVSAAFFPLSFPPYALFVFLSYLGLGAGNANNMAEFIGSSDEQKGVLSSLYGVAQYFVAAVASATVSILGSTALITGILMTIFSLLAVYTAIHLNRHRLAG